MECVYAKEMVYATTLLRTFQDSNQGGNRHVFARNRLYWHGHKKHKI